MILRLLKNRNFVFLFAILAGLAFPRGTGFTEPFMLWALGLVMTLATLNVPNGFFKSPRRILTPSIVGVLMTYLVSGGFILFLSTFFIHQDSFRTGFILIAAVPPAIAVIPFAAALDGNVPYALAGTVASYVAALFVMPLLFFVMIGTSFADPVNLIKLIVILIILPLILSRIALYMNLDRRLASIKGMLTDWAFFIVMYTIIGTNRDLIFEEPLMIAPSVGVAFAVTFLLGFLIEKIGHFIKLDKGDVISLMLLGTLKNLGIAGGLALSLFSKETALPAAVYNIFMILYFIWLDLRRSRLK